MPVERRFFEASEIELRAEGADEQRYIRGYAALYERWSPTYSDFFGKWRERLARGFFSRALKTSDPRALFNHDPNFVLGRFSARTLRLEERAKGLHFEAEAPSTQTIRDLVIAPLERGDVTGASFAFSLDFSNAEDPPDEWHEGKEGVMERTLLWAAELHDVSPVTFPFYPDASSGVKAAVELRSCEEARASEAGRSFERWSAGRAHAAAAQATKVAHARRLAQQRMMEIG